MKKKIPSRQEPGRVAAECAVHLFRRHGSIKTENELQCLGLTRSPANRFAQERAIHRILIILGRATLSSGIQVFLLEVHSRHVQMMVVTNGALRIAPLVKSIGTPVREIQRMQSKRRCHPGIPHPKLVIPSRVSNRPNTRP